jgi:hypothetical protein
LQVQLWRRVRRVAELQRVQQVQQVAELQRVQQVRPGQVSVQARKKRALQ